MVAGAPLLSSPDTRHLSALAGDFLVGWCVMLWCLSFWVYDFAPEDQRRSALGDFLCWFIVDSAGSIASGNASNAVISIAVLLLAVGLLCRPARESARCSVYAAGA